MQNVIPIKEHRTTDSDTVETLRALLVRARAGHIVGVAIAWRCKSGKHSGTTTGLYATDHIAALGAATKLCSQIIDADALTE